MEEIKGYPPSKEPIWPKIEAPDTKAVGEDVTEEKAIPLSKLKEDALKAFWNQ